MVEAEPREGRPQEGSGKAAEERVQEQDNTTRSLIGEPIRKLLPAREIGIDFSPLVALLAAYFFLILLPLPWYLR